MPANLRARLQALEANSRQDVGMVGGVVTYGRHETPEEAVARAIQAGRRGNFLVVPEVMSVEEWEAMMAEHIAQQQSQANMPEVMPPA